MIRISKEKWVDKNHYRVVSDDGRTSWLYKTECLGLLERLVEVTDHHKDGTTDAYEADNSVIGKVFFGSKGEHKGKSKDC